MRRLPILVLIALLFPGSVQTAAAQDAKIERAREALKEIGKERSQALRQLETVYMELEKEFDRIAGPYSAQFLRGLSEAWIEILPGILSRWDQEGENARLISRRRFSEFAEPMLLDGARKVMDLDTRILKPFVDRGVALIYDQARKGSPIEGEAFEADLVEILSPGVYFHHFWNAHLFIAVEEAEAYAMANERFAEAQTALDRLERPERYTAKGKPAPPRMVYVAGGNYTIGPNTGWERSRRRVNLREFYIDKYEVTNKEYRDFLATLDPKNYTDHVPFFWPLNKNMERYYPEDRADHPVTGVSWKSANAYALWRGKRLPSEEEWEAAARGKTSYAYPWGNQFEPGRANTREEGINGTVEVGSFPEGASPSGCMDMAGNVNEWTSTDQEGDRITEADGSVRNVVIRGGDYKETADHARCDFRWMTPMDPYTGRIPSKKMIGFRCVKSVD